MMSCYENILDLLCSVGYCDHGESDHLVVYLVALCKGLCDLAALNAVLVDPLHSLVKLRVEIRAVALDLGNAVS